MMINKYSLLILTLVVSLCSCGKTGQTPNAAGGLLPTHYINIKDSSFTPDVLTVANGSSITFLNKTAISHTIISADSITIVSNAIASDSSYYVKPDTLAGTTPIFIFYHCKEHPGVTGTIILRP